MTSRILVSLILVLGLVSGCSSALHTQVQTINDAIPASGASYALLLSDAQANDLEVRRHARAVSANLVRQGFIERDADKAQYHIILSLIDAGSTDEKSGHSGVGVSYPATYVTASQASVAGVGLPGTQRTTVHSDAPARYTGRIESSNSKRNTYRVEISFLENDSGKTRPIYKVVAEMKSTTDTLHEVAPCLIDAAFRTFPDRDGGKQKVRVERASCS